MSSAYFFSDCSRELNLFAPDFFFCQAKKPHFTSCLTSVIRLHTHGGEVRNTEDLVVPRVILSSCLRKEEKAGGVQLYCLLTSQRQHTQKDARALNKCRAAGPPRSQGWEGGDEPQAAQI